MAHARFGALLLLKTLWASFALGVLSLPSLIVHLLLQAKRLLCNKKGKFSAQTPRCILVSGGLSTKGQEIARAFHGAGHRVILTDTSNYWYSGGRFSRAVDRYFLVPHSTTHGIRAYVDRVKQIIIDEQVDMFVPVPGAGDVHGDAMVKDELAASGSPCFVWGENSKRISMLDDKVQFVEGVKSLGKPIADQYRVSSNADMMSLSRTLASTGKSYILKSLKDYCPTKNLNRFKFYTHGPVPFHDETALLMYLESFKLNDDNPHIVMEYLVGKEFATTSIVLNGQILAYSASEASACQTAFKHDDNPLVKAWVQDVVEKFQLTGSMSFDVIVVDNVVYPLECNPRLHTLVVNFYDEYEIVVNAYLSVLCKEADAQVNAKLIAPTCTKLSYWYVGEMIKVGLALAEGRVVEATSHVRNLMCGREGTFNSADPFPSFYLYHIQIQIQLWSALIYQRPYNRFDFLVGKLHNCA